MRKSPARIRSIFLVAAGATLTLSLLYSLYFDPLRKAETYSRDLRHCWGRKAKLNSDLVFLALDKASIQLDSLFPEEVDASPALTMMKSGYPWSREVYAQVAERLIQAGARVVVFDLLFPTQGTGDAVLRNTLDKYPDRIVLGCDFVAERNPQGRGWRLDLPAETLIDRSRPVDQRVGYVTFWSDPDGPVRRARMTTSLDELSDDQGASKEVFESMEARVLHRLGRGDLIPPGAAPLRFVGGPHTITPFPIYQIFVADLWARNFQNGDFFKNKIVFVGPEGSWSHDEHGTPFRVIDGDEALMPGPEIHLNALNAALNSEFLIELSDRNEILIFIIAGLCGMLCSIPNGPVWRMAASSAAIVGFLQISLVAYNQAGLILPLVGPSAIVILTVGINIISDYRSERKEKAEIRTALGSYVGENLVKEILTNPTAFLHSLGGVRKVVTVMFTDLRDFTKLTGSQPPGELVQQLNEYFSLMTDVVLAHNGSVDKLMGDGMMAVWGNLKSESPAADARSAVLAALAMRRGLDKANADWRARGWPTLRLGIGIAHGEATVGNIGSARKMDFTAIGETVNAASRIERLTGGMTYDILIGGRLAALVGHGFELVGVGAVPLKGIAQPLPVFAVVGEAKTPIAVAPTPMPIAEPALAAF